MALPRHAVICHCLLLLITGAAIIVYGGLLPPRPYDNHRLLRHEDYAHCRGCGESALVSHIVNVYINMMTRHGLTYHYAIIAIVTCHATRRHGDMNGCSLRRIINAG